MSVFAKSNEEKDGAIAPYFPEFARSFLVTHVAIFHSPNIGGGVVRVSPCRF
jgi:hypothetical protein